MGKQKGSVYRLTLALFVGILTGLVWSKFGLKVGAPSLTISFVLLPALLSRSLVVLYVAVFIGILWGGWRGNVVLSNLNVYQDLTGRDVNVSGRVIDDPAYHDSGQTEFYLGKVQLMSPEQLKLRGKIRIRTYDGVGVRRGDQLTISGRMYDGFGSYQAGISYAEVLSKERPESVIEDIRTSYFTGLYSSLPEPEASLGLGFLVGLRTLLPESLLNQLSATGLTHIVAVSGYNLTILIRVTRRLFMRFSKYSATLASIVLMITFMLMTGMSPSIVRAAVVASLALCGWYYGREIKPMVLIIVGAALTAFYNPLYIWGDLGWYLSFLAFIGVLILAPLITRRLFGDSKPKLLVQIVIETTSAQIMALPLIVLIFHELSLISIIANAIILPLIPLAMLLTFVAGLTGMLITPYAGWFAWPAAKLLTFMTGVIENMSQISWSVIDTKININQLIGIYVAVGLVAIVLYRKFNRRLNASELVE